MMATELATDLSEFGYTGEASHFALDTPIGYGGDMVWSHVIVQARADDPLEGAFLWPSDETGAIVNPVPLPGSISGEVATIAQALTAAGYTIA